MKYEVAIRILDKEYVDNLIVSLVHQGYSVYYNDDESVVCFTATDEEITSIGDVTTEGN